MKILANAPEINQEFTRLIRKCSSCQIAVAWASVGFDAHALLAANSSKIERMVVGTHFYQTHPKFIKAFLGSENVRFRLNPDGVFHPKVYLFERASGRWECIIGSPNFTQYGFSSNEEIAILVTSEDHGAQAALRDVRAAIDGFWRNARPISREEYLCYRAAWRRKKVPLRSLQGRFGDPQSDVDDGGHSPLAVPILATPWAGYFRRVQSEAQTPFGHSMTSRLRVIESVQKLFADHEHFSDIDKAGRQKIAGLLRPTEGDPTDYRWFGSMTAAGWFKQAINSNNRDLSFALALIPLTGDLTRETYLRYIAKFKKAFPLRRNAIGTATRLLAMKRPDTFVCFDSRNKVGLCKAFGISRNIDYEKYWDSIIARIMEANWWSSPQPESSTARKVWAARAAFLDSLYYDGAGPS